MSVTADLMDADAKGGDPMDHIVIRDYGDRALLLEFDGTEEVLAWSKAIRDAELLGVLDIVPASRTVLMKLAGARVSGAHPAAAGQTGRRGGIGFRRRGGQTRSTSRSTSFTTVPISMKSPGSPG